VADGDDSEDPHAATGESVWSSDDLPVREEPLEIVWERRRIDAAEPITLQPLHNEPAPDTDPSAGRSLGSKLVIAGAALAIVAVVIGLVTRGGGGDESASPQTTVVPPASSLPTTAQTVPSTTTAPPSNGAVVPVDVPLPAAVAAIQAPTEIIALTSDGTALTLSLPSGVLRSVAVGDTEQSNSMFFGGGDIVVAPEAAALGMVGSTYVILPRTGPPIDVDRDLFGDDIGGLNAIGWQLADDGTARFTVAVYPNSNSNVRFVSVGLTGDVRELAAQAYGTFGSSLGTPDGGWIVNDAGGAYEVDSQGRSVRIDDGTVYAAAGDHRIVRTCDEQRQCSTAVVTVSTGERRTLDAELLPDDFDEMTWGMSLSPDGGAVATTRSRSTQERVLVDFESGEVTTIAPNNWAQASAWAADSSGVFGISSDGLGLQFIGRSGETVSFGEDLGPIVAIGVRHPAAELDPVATVVVGTITPSRSLGPTGLTLVGAGRGGGMSDIDIDAGTMRSWETARRLGQGEATLVSSGDAVVALPRSDDPAFITAAGVESELGDAFSVQGVKLPGPIDGTIWVPEATADDGLAYRLASIDGTTPASGDAARIDLAASDLIGGDGLGGLVVARGGDVFVVGVGDAERLTVGELIAIGAETAYARECDSAMNCSVVRIDRATGERTTPDPGFAPDAIVRGEPGRGAALGTSVSPDGAVLLVQLRVESTDANNVVSLDDEWFFADTATGRTTTITNFHAGQPVIWNAAGTFAVVLSGPDLQIFDRTAGEMVALDAPALRAIGPVAPGSAITTG